MSGIVSNRARGIEPSVTLALNTKANMLKEKGEDVIGLAAGEPDFDTPEVIRKAAIRAIESGKTKYTAAAGIMPLRKAVAQSYSERLGVRYLPEEVVISHGAKHSIFNALYVLTDPGDEVMLLAPYWTSYPEMVKLVGAVPRIVYLDGSTGYKLTPERLEEELAKGKTKVLLFNSPGNPAGIVYSKDELTSLCNLVRKEGIALISDEIYEFLTFSGWRHYSPVTVVPGLREQTVVVTGVSKGYAMTGWRVGFAMAEKEAAYRMAAYQAHATGCPNSISQWAALEAVTKGERDREKMRDEFEKRKNMFGERLSKIQSISYPEPGGAFYFLADVSELYGPCRVSGSAEFCEKLLRENGLLLIPGGAFGCDGMVRFSFAAAEKDLVEALDRFESFVKRYV